MTWAHEHATDLLRKAEARIGEGKHDMAAATLVRAFDVLDQPGARGTELDDLRLKIVERLHGTAVKTGAADVFVQRAARVAAAVARLPVAPAMVRWLALEHTSHDRSAVEVYLAYLEARRPLDRKLAERIYRILGESLRIRLKSDVEAVRDLVPLLERLHAARPGVDFPLLFLGRFRYLEGDFRRARDLLLGLRGPIARSPKVLNVLGRCAEKLNLPDEAGTCYERSLEARERQGLIHFRLGRLLLREIDAVET